MSQPTTLTFKIVGVALLICIGCFLTAIIAVSSGIPKDVTCYHYNNDVTYLLQTLKNNTVIRCLPHKGYYDWCKGTYPDLPICQSRYPSETAQIISIIFFSLTVLCLAIAFFAVVVSHFQSRRQEGQVMFSLPYAPNEDA